ncbi:peptide ABC transporter substrate-binding protein [Rhodophyticola porphyridii]|uniref:Peptide ABC transporter substrate-binding protein n=1 Tax=Rhodophyticola porphyridii TaxID=1852017 RepID=A0A3L9Y2C0_9RHOB|nr:peptide ABC transporter substrate-binding protein [Rhodophyticola porphyridii]RMA41227.1 peptide ABC transporter substrate-binding protein [Rhodophyticola porphyridii]
MTRLSLLTTSTILTFALGSTAWAQATHPVTGETLAEDQTFQYRLLDQFPSIDPQLIEETAGGHVARQLFEGLLTQNADGTLRPGVAESWSSEDNQTWVFNLREDARWSNGDPVTAQDFVASWQRAADPATASEYAWYVELSQISNSAAVIAGEVGPEELGVRAIDDRTLEVTLSQPLPYFPQMTVHYTFMPSHQPSVEEHGAAWTAPENIVSNGAYMLDEIAVNEFFRLVPNPEYWGAENVIITEVTGYIINDASQALTRFQAGEFDMMDDLPAGSYPRLEAEMPDVAHSVPRLCSYYYAINQSESGHEALQDRRVRTALSLMIDREVITDQVLQAGQAPAFNFTHWATAGFEMPEIEYASWTQEERMAHAMELMTEAGYGPDNPIELNLIYNTSENHRQIATVISQMWRPLGVSTVLNNFEWQSYLEIRGNQNFDVARSAWCGDYNEASTFLDLLTSNNSNNDGKYANDEVDRLMAESVTMADPQPNYTAVEQILSEDMAIIPIYHYTQNFVLDPTIRNWPMENVENNWYVRDIYRVAAE